MFVLLLSFSFLFGPSFIPFSFLVLGSLFLSSIAFNRYYTIQTSPNMRKKQKLCVCYFLCSFLYVVLSFCVVGCCWLLSIQAHWHWHWHSHSHMYYAVNTYCAATQTVCFFFMCMVWVPFLCSLHSLISIQFHSPLVLCCVPFFQVCVLMGYFDGVSSTYFFPFYVIFFYFSAIIFLFILCSKYFSCFISFEYVLVDAKHTDKQRHKQHITQQQQQQQQQKKKYGSRKSEMKLS